MRKVLVTGGAGFVGRHLVRRLLTRGDEVHCVDNLAELTGAIDPRRPGSWPFFNPLDHAAFHFYAEDCRSYFKRVSDTDFDEAFHVAAVVGGRKIIEERPMVVAEDLSIDAEYWMWAARARPGKSVVFSSSAVYPVEFQKRGDHVLLQEDMVSFDKRLGIPDLVYGWAKLTTERLAHIAYQSYGLASVVYRPFSGYGEDQDGAYPFVDVLRRVLEHRGASTIKVWGTGEQLRDFIHIDDCVEGILSTMGKIDDGQAVNLSTGVGTSFREFVRIAADVLGFAPEVVGTPGTPEGVFARVGDTTRQRALGFAPGIDLRAGIERGLKHLG